MPLPTDVRGSPGPLGAETPVTVGDALESARQLLEQAGVPDARREAVELYSAIVCAGASAGWLSRGVPIPTPTAARLRTAAELRAQGWPQAYAAGRACFRGHWLNVDPRVLIPRPETEQLVEHVIGWAAGRASPPVVADIGTGSGAMAIALALEARVAGVIATDISADALNVALENATLLGARERVGFRRGDLLGALLDDVVDAVVSNPPYVSTGEWEALEPAVREHEPRLALDGGPDGLGPTRRLAHDAAVALSPGGLLALEVDCSRAAATAAIAADAGFEEVEVREDLFGRPRYLLGRRPERG